MWTEFCHGLCSMRRESWIFHFCSHGGRKEKSVAILEFKCKRKWNQNLKQEPHFVAWFDTNFGGKFESFDFEADGYDRFVNWLQRFHALRQIRSWIGTSSSSPCWLCQGAEDQFQNQRAIRPCPRQPSFRRQEWTRHLVKFSILRLHLNCFA